MFNKALANPNSNISSRLTNANNSLKLINKQGVTYDSLSSYWSFCALCTIYPFSNVTRGFAQNRHANILTVQMPKLKEEIKRKRHLPESMSNLQVKLHATMLQYKQTLLHV